MKKYSFFLLSLLGMFLFLTSCKKHYSCQCEWYKNSELYVAKNYDLGDLRKSDAKFQCEQKTDDVTIEDTLQSFNGSCRAIVLD